MNVLLQVISGMLIGGGLGYATNHYIVSKKTYIYGDIVHSNDGYTIIVGYGPDHENASVKFDAGPVVGASMIGGLAIGVNNGLLLGLLLGVIGPVVGIGASLITVYMLCRAKS